VFYPAYESMCADNDFCEWARQDGVVINARHLMFPHRHPLYDDQGGWRRPKDVDWDKAYQAQNRPEAYELGKTVWAWRRMVRFGKAIKEAKAIEGWMSQDELECLSLWASQMQSIVEIGSWKGRSTYALCMGTAGRVTAVDHFHGSPDEPEHAEKLKLCGGSTLAEFEKNTARCSNLSVLVQDSLGAAKEVPDADMVFLDGRHSYEEFLADLKAWLPKARKLICGHDIQSPGVARAVREVLGDVECAQGSVWFKALSRKRVIALCLPGEHFDGAWVDGILNLYGHLVGLDFSPIWRVRGYTSNVYMTREEIREAVLKLDPKPDLLLWLDDDNILTPQQFNQLLADLDSHLDVDGMMGWCWIHDDQKRAFHPSCGVWSPDHVHWMPFDASFAKETELRPVEVGGLPCLLMRLSALEKAGERPFLPILGGGFEHGMSGEDIAFFLAAEKGGAKFLVDPQVRLTHVKCVSVEPVFPEEGAPDAVKIACMIRAKNEARWITRAIESVKPLCAENIFVMEDNSIDDTYQLARNAGAKVFKSPFSADSFDECRDKNWLMQQIVEACSPDWIFGLDGDEELEPEGAEKIKRVLGRNPPVDCFALRFLYLWDAFDQIRVDGRYSSLTRESLFRALPGYTFGDYYPDRPGTHAGLHCSNAPYRMRTAPMNVFLLHYGYVFQEDRIRKYRWIRTIDPENAVEDNYRHMVQGDLPEFPADAVFKHGGPLRLQKLTPRLVPRFDVIPEPAVSGSAVTPFAESGDARETSEPASAAVRLNLGCCERRLPGFLGVDVRPGPAVDVVADLRKRWPWADGSIHEIVAHDVIEHLPDRILTMNEIHRVLKPGGRVQILVPTTNGPGAFQDPTHLSFWNRHSFWYFEKGNVRRERFAKQYGIKASFRVVGEKSEVTQDGEMLMIQLQKVA
jgi:precorrin-6B methylase 2